jgi:hypothetical protein
MRVVLKTKEGSEYVGLAKSKHRELEALRKRTGAPVMQKVFRVGDVRIKLFAAQWDSYVEISGGESVLPTMLLSGGAGTFAYNYLKNKKQKVSAAVGGLFRGAKDILFQAGSHLIYKIKGRSVSSTPVSFVGDFHHHRLTNAHVRMSGRSLSVYIPEVADFVHLSSLLFGQAYGELGMKSHQIYIGVLGRPSDTKPWNLAAGFNTSMVPLISGASAIGEAWRWYPRMWNPEIGNYLYLLQGIYYGSVQGGGFWGPCKEASARFLTTLDARGGDHFFGYAEMLLSTKYEGHEFEPDGTQYHAKMFFMLSMWEPSRSFFYDEDRGRIWFQNNYWTDAPEQEFRIDLDDYIDTKAEAASVRVSWWSLSDLQPPPWSISLPKKRFGVLSYLDIGDRTWILHRYAGYSSVVKKGKGYRDHSYTDNGEIVSIIYDKEDGTYVFVYNLAAEGGGEELAHHKINGSDRFLWGQLVEKEESPVFEAHPGSSEVQTSPDRDIKYAPSLFGMSHPWPPGNGYTAGGWKVTVNGEYAEGFFWDDECWKKAEYTMWHDFEYEHNVFESTKLIMAGGPNGRHGTMGGLSGQGDDIYPTTGGTSPAGDGMKVARTGISFGTNIYGCLDYSRNTKSPVQWVGDVEEFGLFGSEGGCWRPVPGCYEDEDGRPVGRVKLIDDCAMEAEVDFPFNYLTISGPDVFLEGSSYSGSGGTPPYSYTSDCGGINSTTGEVTNDSSCCNDPDRTINEIKVTVKDSCGRSASMISRGKNGIWETVSDNGTPPWPAPYLVQVVTSGSTRTTNIYTSNGCECTPEESWNPGGCVGFQSHECTGSGYAFDTEICGATASSTFSDLDGELSFHSAGDSHPSVCYVWAKQIRTYGWKLYAKNPAYGKVERWKCP